MTFRDFVEINKPQYEYIIDKLGEIVGHEPDWEDFTKSGLYHIKDKLSDMYAPNTARNKMDILKSILNRALGEQPLPYDRFSDILKHKRIASTAIFLTVEELERLYKLPTDRSFDTYAKSVFLIQSWTGARYCDAVSIDTTNIVGDEVHYVAQKTGTEVRVPVKPIVEEMIRLRNSVLSCSKVTVGERLKSLAYHARIKQTVKIYKAGKYIQQPKYNFVTTHTARRSFATNLLLAGADVFTISKLMGHSSVSMTQRYICSSNINDNLKTFFK